MAKRDFEYIIEMLDDENEVICAYKPGGYEAARKQVEELKADYYAKK